MIEKKDELQFITCPECQGSGRGEMGFGCFNCQEMGQGVLFKGRFLFFGPKLDIKKIKFPLIKNRFDRMVNFTSFFLAFLGLLSLSFWYYLNFSQFQFWQDFLFWQYTDILILFFWLGALFFIFGIYKIIKEGDEEKKISDFKEVEESLENIEDWEEIKKYKYKYDTAEALSRESLRTIAESYKIAKRFKHQEITPLHLFAALIIQDSWMIALFDRLNINQQELFEKIGRQLNREKQSQKNARPSRFNKSIKKIFISGFVDAYELGQENVKPFNLVTYCTREDDFLKELLLDFKIDERKIENVLSWFRTNEEIIENIKTYKKVARFKPKSNMDRAYTSVETTFLNKCSYDLTLAAKWGRLGLCVSREKEINKIFNSLTGVNRGVVLVGPEGVGKKTIVKGVARLMVREKVPDFLWDKRLLELDVARLLSGATPSQSEERILRVLDEIFRAGNIVLYIKNIDNLIGIKVGEEGGMDLSEALVDGLERRGIYCLATTTKSNFYQYVEKSAITGSMAKIDVSEPEGDQAIRIIESKIGLMEAKFKGVFFSYNAIESAIELSQRYIHDKHLPQKALEIIEQTGIRLFKSKKKKEKVLCKKNDIALTIKEMTNIPVDEVSEEEGIKLLGLEKEIHKHIINQSEAVNMVSDSLRRARVELKEEKKTISNFLFLGPTGVGKTELAKTVSKVYLGKEEFMIRLDMSEYQHEDSVKKIIGDTSGKKGYLTEAVRKNPFSLILLDEFEKAHPKILDLFLQVTDEGRLTDGQGRTVDFTSSIIIATSNIGSRFIEKEISVGKEIKDIKEVLINEKLIEVIKPELINRFDGVIIFKPLSMKNVVEITKLIIEGVRKMLENKSIILKIDEAGVRKLAEEGHDPKFGARPLRRLIKKKIENEIAKKILSGELSTRDTVIINHNVEIEVEKAKKL